MPTKFIDLTGLKFNHLTVIKIDPQRSPSNKIKWICLCDCGNTITVIGSSLKTNNTKTCGDLQNCKFAFQIKSNSQIIHNQVNSLEYNSWADIIQRCTNYNNPAFNRYGGRGIIIFELWKNSFKDFYDYLLTLPETREQFETRTGKKATIDRIDNEGNYEPGNIKWSSYQQQNQNRRSTALTPEMVKYIRIVKIVDNILNIDIYRQLITNFKYTGSEQPINKVLQNNLWNNITISNEEIELYRNSRIINNIQY